MNDITLCLSDPILSELIYYELTRAGYSVSTAKCAEARLVITDAPCAASKKNDSFILCISEVEKKGADAFLQRPFSLGSLRWAVAPFFASRNIPGKKEKAPTEFSVICDGVLINGEKIKLSPAEHMLITALCSAGGEPVSRESLNSLLGMRGNAADVYICNIRKKLAGVGEDGLIRTVRSYGYALITDS